MKAELTALAFVILHRIVFADSEYLHRCPEYNPQNELDIELVSLCLLLLAFYLRLIEM